MASRRAAKAWQKLAQWYGSRLADQYGASVPMEWAVAIDRTDDDRLEIAMSRVKREHVKYPPTLGEFEAAIPQKQLADAGPSMATRLCEWVVANRRLCDHQKAAPWTYLGPVEEFISKHRGNEVVKHPRIAAVFVAECKACDRPAVKIREEQITEPVAA